ncbi:MAG: hypothetical protein JSW08_01850 [archaeon]|nr:MAG: hypothetical protein JSW08_01850 [archaeon]
MGKRIDGLKRELYSLAEHAARRLRWAPGELAFELEDAKPRIKEWYRGLKEQGSGNALRGVILRYGLGNAYRNRQLNIKEVK